MDFFMKTDWKGIYLHGYKGNVTPEKKMFLEGLGEIYAPTIDYDQQPTIIFQLLEQFKDQKLDFVAGTSLGGLLIYHVAMMLEVPCLLLNPAVTALEQVKPFLPQEALKRKHSSKLMVLTGMEDEMVDPLKQIEFFENRYTSTQDFQLIQDSSLGHFVPYETFEATFHAFFKFLK